MEPLELLADCYDFRSRCDDENIRFHSCDFNKAEELAKVVGPFDFGFCVHTLEHLLYPRQFLEALHAQNTRRSFWLYIEVPAFDLLEEKHAEYLDMVQPNHIHMFSRNNLESMARTSGYRVLECRHDTQGDLPRIQLLIQKQQNVENNLVRFLDHQRSLLERTAAQIAKECHSNRAVGLWGIGGEFCNLARSQPQIMDVIHSSKAVLLDSALHGRLVFGRTIFHPNSVATRLDKIVLLPMKGTVRESITTQALSLGFPRHAIIDPYANQCSNGKAKNGES